MDFLNALPLEDYDRLYSTEPKSWLKAGWSSEVSQLSRFKEIQRILSSYRFRDILDIGCNDAELYNFLRKCFTQDILYTGIDVFGCPLKNASHRFPNLTLYQGNFFDPNMKLPPNDIVVCSGVLSSYSINKISSNELDFFLKRVFGLSKIIAIVNCLRPTMTSQKENSHFGITPEKMVEFAGIYFRKVCVHADYSQSDVTYLLIK